MSEQTFIDLNNNTSSSKTDNSCDQLCWAYLSEPLVYITPRGWSHLSLHCHVCHRVFSGPPQNGYQPLLESNPTLREETEVSDAPGGLTLWAGPTDTIRAWWRPSPFDHWNSTPIFPFIIIMLIMDIPYYNIRYLPCTVAGSCKQSFTPKITDNTPCPTSHHCWHAQNRHTDSGWMDRCT